MTVDNTYEPTRYTGDGVTVDFDFDFLAKNSSELFAAVNHTQTVLYSATGFGNQAGGTVTFDTAPASGVPVVLWRATPKIQDDEYTTYNSFPSDVLEADFDENVKMIQETCDEVSRAIRFPVEASETGNPLFPADPTVRANRVIGFNADGELNLIETQDGVVVAGTESGLLRATDNGANILNSDAQNLAAIDAFLDAQNERILIVDDGITWDSDNLVQKLYTWIFDEETGRLITGNVAIESGYANAQHITMRTVKDDNISQLWIMPRGDTDDTNQIAAVKIFGDDFEEEQENPTGEGGGLNYRDCALAWHNEDGHNGVGIALVNTKVNGDFIPVRGDGGLSFQGGQEIPLRWLWVQGEVAAAHNAGDRFYKFRSPSIWLSRFDYDQWDLCHVFGRVYEAQAAISAGGTKPVHTSGTTDDWKYLDDLKPSSGYTSPIPTIMIGDRTDEPLLPFPDVTLQCSMSMMMHYQKFIRFANNLGDEADFTIRRDAQAMEFLADTTSGEFLFQADETNNGGNARQLRVNNERVLTENLQFTVNTLTKADTDTTLDVTGANHIAFDDQTATFFTGFTNGRAGMDMSVRCNTANTTFRNSATLQLPDRVATEWTTATSATLGFIWYYLGNVYQATNSATTGATPPTHTSGTVSDGAVNWLYLYNHDFTPDAGSILEFRWANGTTVQLRGERPRIKTIGLTTQRPANANCWIGREYFDTTIGQPIWFNGTDWSTADGTTGV